MTTKPTPPPVAPAAEAAVPLPAHTVDGRPYSPGLEGVLAAETELGLVDGANGRLMYRGYRIGDLVAHGTFASVANLLWTGDWDPKARLTAGRGIEGDRKEGQRDSIRSRRGHLPRPVVTFFFRQCRQACGDA